MKTNNYQDTLKVAASQKVKERTFWLETLSGELTKTSFPYDYGYKRTSGQSSETLDFSFSSHVSAQLVRLSGGSDFTLHMILSTGLAVLLARYTGQSDVIMGTPLYRQDTESDFINTLLPLRLQLEKDDTFKQVLLKTRGIVIRAVENYGYPIEFLLDELGYPILDNEPPLFDTAILLKNIHDKKYLRPIHFNMIFSFNKTGDTVELELEYNSSLYSAPFIGRLCSHFDRLFANALSRFDTPVSQLELLSGRELEELLHHFNDTRTQYPGDKTIRQLFEEQVALAPDRIALVAPERKGTAREIKEGPIHLSYSQLNKRSNQVAHMLIARGIQPEDIVAVMLESPAATITAILGILKAGGAYMPLSPDAPSNRIRAILKDSRAALVITEHGIVRNVSFTGLQGLDSVETTPLVTAPRPFIKQLDDLPIPDRSTLNYEEYNKYIGLGLVKDSISIMATRGCPYNCIYCHKLWPKSHVYRSAENIFEEIRMYYDMGVRRFCFIDDIFNLNKKNSRRVFESIIKNKMDLHLLFPSGLRGDILTEDYIDLMVEAGTIEMGMALETASPRLQKLIGKNLNLEKLHKNMDYVAAKYPNVILELFTMHGFPTETEEEAMMTMDFIKSIKWIHIPLVNILKIYPNTDMERLALENGISKEAITVSLNRAFHELPETLPFDKSFTKKYQSDFLNEYFLSKERLLHVLPHQMKVLTRDEIVQKYDSYLPVQCRNFDDILKFTGLTRDELGDSRFLADDAISVPDINTRLKKKFPQVTPARNAMRVLLLDLSQFFSSDSNMLYDVVEAPLGLVYLMTALKEKFGAAVNGKIAKSRIDFNDFSGLKTLLNEFKPDIIGIRTLSFFKDFFHETVSYIRQWGIDAPIITGGPYATSSYKTILKDRNIDAVCLGEGEITICDLISRMIDRNKTFPDTDTLEKIPGIAFIPGNPEQRKQAAREIVLMNPSPGQNLMAGLPDENPPQSGLPSHLAYIMYTSGSTGKPKGVMVENRNVVRLVKNTNFVRFNPGQRILQTGAMDFDAATFEIWGSLLNGLGLYLPFEDTLLDPGQLKVLIRKYHIQTMWLTSPLFNQLADIDIQLFDGVENLLVGGDVLSPRHIGRVKDRFPRLNIINGYGPTENTTFSVTHPVDVVSTDSIPIGRPIANSTAYIFDSHGQIVPVGVYGELVVGGDGLARGYLNNPRLTREKFIDVPYQQLNPPVHHGEHCPESVNPGSHVRLYRTGDMARWLPDGTIEFMGRVDHQVKLRGFRIELGEIEHQLLRHKQIKECVVTAKTDNTGNKFLCAYVVSAAGENLDDTGDESGVSRWRDFLTRDLPQHMIPSYFVPLEKLPLNSNGKVDRAALPDPRNLAAGKTEYEAPGNETEEILATVLSDVLGIEEVGIHDDFYEIGGDSIKSIQITARLHKIGYKLEISDLLMSPTIAQLAPKLKKLEQIADQSAVTGTVPLTPIQAWFFNQSFNRSHHFNNAVMLYSRETLDETAVRAIFARIQEHHDALRMTYRIEPGTVDHAPRVIQTCNGLHYPVSLQVHDLRSGNAPIESLEAVANKIQAGIDLQNGPLMNLALFRLHDGDRLLIVAHHLVIDAVSWRILLEDIQTLVQQHMQGLELKLPFKTDSFKRWSERQSQYADSPGFLEEKPYWRELLSTPVPQIPKDFDRDRNIKADSATLTFSLSKDETRELLTRVNDAFGTEINHILLTALGLSAQKTFGIDRLAVALEAHGREKILEDIDINRTVGWFTSLYPVILDMHHTGDLGRQLKEIKETINQVPNKGIGFGILKYLTSAEHKQDIDFRIEPQVCFNYLGQFGSDLKQMSSFGIAEESPGHMVSPHMERTYQLEVSGLISGDSLDMSIVYNTEQYKEETILSLLDAYKNQLRQLISFCCSRGNRCLTPSDLTYKQLSIETLDRLQTRYPIEDLYPLTPLQEGMLFHSMVQTDIHTDFVQISYRLRGDFRLDLVEKSLRELSNRHDILRTAFLNDTGGRPVQVVVKNRCLTLYHEDVQHLSTPEDKESYILRFKEKDRDKPFDLAADVLMRTSVLQLDKDLYHFIWSFHHILMDGWCSGILIAEFFQIYQGFLSGFPHRLPETKPYRTYIQWLEKQDMEESRQFWQTYVRDFRRPSTIGALKSQHTAGLPYKKEKIVTTLDHRQTRQLNRIAALNKVTLNTVFQALWGMLLGYYNRTDDVVFGVIVSGRPPEIEGVETMVGLFINTIPFRLRFHKGQSFNQVLAGIHDDSIKRAPHHYFPLTRIQAQSELKQDLMDHILAFENYPVVDQLEGFKSDNTDNNASTGNDTRFNIDISHLEVFEQTNYDFFFEITVRDQLDLHFNYNENLYPTPVIRQIARHFTRLTERIIRGDQTKIGDISLLSEEEKEQVLVDFNRTATEYPREDTIHGLFSRQAALTPEKIALAAPGRNGRATLTYRELHEQSGSLARLLYEHGARHHDIIAVQMEPGLDMMVALVAILKAGAAYLPVNPSHPSPRRNYLIADANVRLLLSNNRDASYRNVQTIIPSRRGQNTPLPGLEIPGSARDLAYIIYTSGSTGQPKGVMVEHRNVVRLVRNTNFIQFHEDGKILQTGAVDFDASTFEIWGAFLNGLELHLADKDALLNHQELKQTIRENRIDIMWMTSPLFNRMVDTDIEIFQGLRYLLVGGDVLSPPRIERVRQQYPDIKIINGYGPTENTTFSTTFQVDKEYRDSIPIGKPIANSTAYILDWNRQPAPVGVYGQLAVGGDGVARGYLNNPELTAQKFHADPFGGTSSTISTLYDTGDQARWLPDGNIQFAGRIDSQVKIRGFRIELGEIGKHLSNDPQIKENIVLAKHDQNGDKYLCAYIVPRADFGTRDQTADDVDQNPFDITELRNRLARHMPAYMLPSFFVPLKKMPLNTNGKIDRNALPEPRFDAPEEFAEPRTPEENLLAAIWSEVLGAPKVGIYSNFFEIGGDSIKSIQIGARLKQAGYKLEIKDIFTYPTISELAVKITRIQRIPDQSIVTGAVPLTPIQHWFFDSKKAEPHHFNLSAMLYSVRTLGREDVETVFLKILEHHDALRLTYSTDPGTDGIRTGEIVQINRDTTLPLSLDEFDLRSRPNPVDMLQSAAGDLQAGISLEHGPLLKLGLFHLDDGDRLLIVIHHLVIDTVSWRILLEDIETLFQQLKDGKPLGLPLKTDSFKLWAQQLSDYADQPSFLSQAEYWRQVESTVVSPIRKDFRHEDNFIDHTHSLSVRLDREETRLLLTKTNEAFGTEINDILLTALAAGVKQTLAPDARHLAIALEGHGRENFLEEIDVSRTIGWFTSSYPVILDTLHDTDLSRQIIEVKETLRRVPNKGTGYGILKYLTHPRNKEGIQFRLKPGISFNYLGQFDVELERMSTFQIAKESSGDMVSPHHERDYELDISGMIVDNRLEITVAYNKNQFRSRTVQNLLNCYKNQIQRIIAFCTSREYRRLTPSDLTYNRLPVQVLETLQTQYDIEDVYPLTPMQEGMLFHSLLDPHNSVYCEQVSYRLNGDLDETIIRDSMNQLLKRYRILRTAFIHKGVDRPLQVVLEDRRVEYYYKDISRWSTREQTRFVKQYREKDWHRPFDLSRDVLMRVAIIRLSPNRLDFIWSYHHILIDGWCLGILISDFLEFIDAYRQDRPFNLAPVKPYRSYIQWLSAQDKDQAKTFWSKYLEGFREVSFIAEQKTLKARPDTYREEAVNCIFDNRTTLALNRLAGKNQVTLNTVIQTVWGILLSRYNRTGDTLFGAVVSGRPAQIEGVETIVGLFINTVPVRIRVQDNMTVKDIMRRVQDDAVRSEPFHYYPLADIQAQSHLNRQLIDHILIFENYPFPNQLTGSGDMEIQAGQDDEPAAAKVEKTGQTNYDFNVIIIPGDSLTINFKYNANVYDREIVERISAHFQYIAAQVIDRDDLTVEDIALLEKEERKSLLFELNRTHLEYPHHQTIHGMFENQAAQKPDALALTYQNRHYTYRKLNRQANRLARFLKDRGLPAHSVIGLIIDRSIEMITATLAVLKARCAYLPIAPGDPDERKKYIIHENSPAMILSRGHLILRNMPVLKDIDPVKIIDIDDPGNYSPDASNLLDHYQPTDPAYIVYTSGTTGVPNGILVEHRNVASYIWGLNQKIYREYRKTLNFCLVAPYVFDGFLKTLFGSLLFGHHLNIVPENSRLDGKRLLRFFRDNQIEIADGTPAHVFMMLESATDQEPRLKLKNFIVSGDVLPVETVKRFIERFSSGSLKFTNIYGVTECTGASTMFSISSENISQFAVFPVGKPLPNERIYIVDNRYRLLPVGMTGEIYIAGDGVARGYIKRDQLNAKKFLPDPFFKGQRMYRTGDLGCWLPDGYLQYKGRMDRQVKIRGFRIEPAEIERAIKEKIPVKKTAVLLRQNRDGDKYLCAYIVPQDPKGRKQIDQNGIDQNIIDITSLENRLADRLPSHMIPSYFIEIEKIPLTANGKIDSAALPLPELESGTAYVAPRDDIEKQLVAIFSRILDLESTEIGIDHHFFKLGGHSLKATVLASGIYKTFNVTVPLLEVFRNPTVRQLSGFVKARKTPDNIMDDQHLVLLKKIDDRAENLFFVHDGTGEVEGYVEFCNHLNGSFNLWGIRTRRTENLGPRSLTIPEIARDYIRKIKKVQPAGHGPYHLAGWSLGGNIAFEIASQLEQEGQDVRFLALLDSHPPKNGHEEPIPLNRFDIGSELSIVREHLQDSRIREQLRGVTQLDRFWAIVKDYLEANPDEAQTILHLVSEDGMPSLPGFIRNSIGDLIYYMNVGRSFRGARESYVPSGKIKAPGYLFRAIKSDFDAHAWKDYFSGPVKYFEIDSDHYSIFQSPQVHHLSSVFNRELAQHAA